ncbi:MAG TPA: NAD(P)/FAD-dependent oxidoreductase [Lacipirellulaceae bacterium]|nr:NAD(P)/FAD-dependent oxidoreductase [Lacipirellulaceae bacterium]
MTYAPTSCERLHRVVIVGGGFGGLNAARALRRAPVRVTLIDRRNFHLFQPLLYQVATGGLSPANIAAPLRWIVERQKNCDVLLGEVHGFDVANRLVQFNGTPVPYDTLIVAAGARYSYFGHPEWETVAPGLKSIEDATEIRGRFLSAFELAERETDAQRRRVLLTFVVVGAGPTGVEMAGTMAEVARFTLKHEFRNIDPSDSQILLVEAGDRILPAYPPDLSAKAEQSLERLGVVVRTKTMVTNVAGDHVMLKFGGAEERLATRHIIWAAGVEASPLTKALAETTGAKLDRAGRIAVEPDLSLAGHPEIFVLGDMANYSHQDGKLLPGVAPVAIQQGRFVARLIAARLRGQTLPAFRYKDRGNMATIGRSAAVADLGNVHLSGFVAWLMWLVVHLANLISFGNRLLVLVQWAWNYTTFDRSARLITGQAARREERGVSGEARDKTR